MASVSVGGFQLEFKIRFLKHVIRTNYIHYNKCIQTEFVLGIKSFILVFDSQTFYHVKSMKMKIQPNKKKNKILYLMFDTVV